MKHSLLANLPGTARAGLDAFVTLLQTWNRRINLVADASREEIWRRHILDSLQLVAHVGSEVESFMDLGSGAGFPGLVVAIATRCHGHLVESDQRKAAFLREAARVTGAPVSIHVARIEAMDEPVVPLIMARALAPLTSLLALAYPRLSRGGECLFLKGRAAADELTQARAEWQMDAEFIPSDLDREGCVMRIRHLEPIRPA